MFTLMKINCTLTLLRENLNFHWNNLVKFELKIIKEARKDIKNGPQMKPIYTFLAK